MRVTLMFQHLNAHGGVIFSREVSSVRAVPNVGDTVAVGNTEFPVVGRHWLDDLDHVTVLLAPADDDSNLDALRSVFVHAGWTDEVEPM